MNETARKWIGRFFDNRRNEKTDIESHIGGKYVDGEFHIFLRATSRDTASEVHRVTGNIKDAQGNDCLHLSKLSVSESCS